MDSMNMRFYRVLALVLLAQSATLAQMPSAGSPTDLNAAFFKLFGSVSAFTAKVDTQVLDKSQKEWIRMPMTLAALDNKVRLEVNLAEVKSKDVPESAVANLKQMGMDRVVSIIRPDKKTRLILYPAAQGYVSMPLAAAEVEAWEKGLQMEKTPVGKETVDGHACVKHRVVVKNAQGPALEATTWNAADLRDFPVQIETKEKENTVLMRFSQIQLGKPAAKQFELPAGYHQMK
jgi:hypothetical protein